MQTLSKRKSEKAAFEDDSSVLRVLRNHKFIVSRAPVSQFNNTKTQDSFYQISCNPNLDVRSQSMLFERAMISLGYNIKEVEKNIMVTGLAPRSMSAKSAQGTITYLMDQGLLQINFASTTEQLRT